MGLIKGSVIIVSTFILSYRPKIQKLEQRERNLCSRIVDLLSGPGSCFEKKKKPQHGLNNKHRATWTHTHTNSVRSYGLSRLSSLVYRLASSHCEALIPPNRFTDFKRVSHYKYIHFLNFEVKHQEYSHYHFSAVVSLKGCSIFFFSAGSCVFSPDSKKVELYL